ncbi:hypothetical protein BCR44DRAFT_220172 [Catenaria anguillulae PL171]|uniref:Uncharacterized protein n=1 Tax=Catenaria anguillulae PL171 TaxID=765915 RepID=A0A1Y2HKE3_9FUNG|nr:hypothetical protein BCR44DRAFT_220172 [Catenaria anguillulae PL171]
MNMVGRPLCVRSVSVRTWSTCILSPLCLSKANACSENASMKRDWSSHTIFRPSCLTCLEFEAREMGKMGRGSRPSVDTPVPGMLLIESHMTISRYEDPHGHAHTQTT